MTVVDCGLVTAPGELIGRIVGSMELDTLRRGGVST